MERPPAPPEAVLIRLAREAAGIPIATAAARAGVSVARWSQIETGSEIRHGQVSGVTGRAGTIARMASVIPGIDPERLAGRGQRADAAEILREIRHREAESGAPPRLASVPSPPESLELGPGDIVPDMDPPMREAARAHVQGLRKVFRLVALKGTDTPGSVFFSDPHEAERWDRLVEAGYVEKPGVGYSPIELIWLIAMGRVYDDEYQAASGQPDRARKALTRVT
jgi:hypothetical protein